VVLQLQTHNISDQIAEIIEHINPEILKVLGKRSNYIALRNKHKYYCALDHCGKEIQFPEVPFIIINDERTGYISFHYQCAFKKDSVLHELSSQFANLKLF